MGEEPKRKVGRPRRTTPVERIHITLGTDVMKLVRAERKLLGKASYSKMIENIIIQHYANMKQYLRNQRIV